MNNLASYTERIRQIAPDLTINSVSINSEGLLNDVLVVNGELIFRFPKHEYALKHLKDEVRILRLLQNHITLHVPSPIYETNDCLASRMIAGDTLRRDMLLKLSPSDQQRVADQLAQFSRNYMASPSTRTCPWQTP